jgi:hypothetical protein
MNPGLIKSFVALTAIFPRSIVAFAAASADNSAALASVNTDPLFGISDSLGADAGQMADVYLSGIAPVELGGTVEAGDPLTSDADGKAIAAVAAPGTSVRTVGFAMEPGVVGDHIDIHVVPGNVTA